MEKLHGFISVLIVLISITSFSQKNESIEKYSLKFQMTSVYQWHPAFPAKYSGANSMLAEEQRALSVTSTLFLDVPLWKGALLSFNPEMAGGEGLSEAKGLGGFPNGETFRIGNPRPAVYLARLLIQQHIQLKENQSITLVAGKFGLGDYFDNSTFSHDPRTQFLNWSLMSYGAWDYAANTRGYTDGLYVNYQCNNWQIRGSVAAMPTDANGPNLKFSFSKSYGLNVELEKKFNFNNQNFAIVRILGFKNVANMGNYDVANIAKKPDISKAREEGRTKYGIGINAEYNHKNDWGVFTRMSYNDGKNETWAFTEIDQSFSLGLNLLGKMWGRPNDFAGFAIAINGLSKSHQKYQELGGKGFMIGDGNLNYGTEKIAEAFYSFTIPNSKFILSPDYQFALNPAYNRDRGPIHFFGLRFHTEF
jgi:high affinity Mn2+ porin